VPVPEDQEVVFSMELSRKIFGPMTGNDKPRDKKSTGPVTETH